MDTLLGNNFRFVHLFHGIELAIFLHVDAPHLAESSLTDHVIELKVVATYFDVFTVLLDLLLNYYLILFAVLVGQF